MFPGSVLGPHLVAIYIGDIEEGAEGKVGRPVAIGILGQANWMWKM